MRSAFRLWNPSTSSTEINSSNVGQSFWDSLRSRFGVFNNRSGHIEWYPEVNADLTLNMSQRLRGRDSADAVNDMVLSFDTPGFIKLIHTPSSTVVASFSAAGAVFNSASLVANGIPGITNQLLNAGLQVKRSLIPFDKSGVMSDLSMWENNVIIAPNWIGYRAPGSAGHVSFYVDIDVPTGIGAHNSVRVDAKSAPTDAGLRHWMHDIGSLGGKTITLSAYVKGPVGSQCRARVITEIGGEIANINFTGTGAWVRQSITLTLPSDGSKWLAYDSIYRPGHAAPTLVTWRCAAPQVNHTATVMTFEPRPVSVETALLRGVYAELFSVLAIGTSIGTPVNLGLMDIAGASPTSPVVPKIKIVPDTGAATMSVLNSKYGVIAPTSTAGSVKIMAHMLPSRPETA